MKKPKHLDLAGAPATTSTRGSRPVSAKQVIADIERITKEFPSPPDPFGFGNFMGMKVDVIPDRPRYVLPDDVPPPTGMTREEFHQWSLEVCGTVPAIPPGAVYCFGQNLVMNPRDAVMLTNIA